MSKLSTLTAAADRGGTAVEYALIAGIMVLAIAVAAMALGAVIDNPFAAAAECTGDLGKCPK
jgi:Flp pilus assembly pilin Flp